MVLNSNIDNRMNPPLIPLPLTGNLTEVVEEVSQLRISSDSEMITALNELSKLPETSFMLSTLNERHVFNRATVDLRTLIENQQIASNRKFLNSLKEVKDSVKELEIELTTLNTICSEMAKNLSASKQNSRNLIDEIAKLDSERKKLIKERDIATAYQNAFQLNAEDLKILRTEYSNNDILSQDYFAVFEKIQRIQSHVGVIMKIGHQVTAIEILDQMGLFQESALEKLYRWSQSHCRNIENPQIAEVLSKALSKLEIRPMLLKYVVDEYTNHRRSLVVRNFIDVLTGVGNNKGIELIGSIDPVRYIGDMLAWIHQSIPIETENLQILLSNCSSNKSEEYLQNCLATILDGVCRPLNVRIEQTIAAGYNSITVNKIDLVLQNFVATFEKAVPGSNLLTIVCDLQVSCHQTFTKQLSDQVQVELGEFRPPSSELNPSPVIGDLLTLVKELLEPNASSQQMQNIVDIIITPLVSQVNLAAARLGSPDQGIYLMNCINEILKLLETIVDAEDMRKALQGQIDAAIDRLSADQSSWLVAQLGIGHIYTILHEKMEDPLSAIPGMDPSSLRIFVNKLDTLISNPESILLPQFIHIAEHQTRKLIQKQSFRILVAIYKQIYDAVLDSRNQYPPNLLILDPASLESSLCS